MFTQEMLTTINSNLREILTNSTNLLESEKDDILHQLAEVLEEIAYFA